jgi:hypothetical protein
MMETTDLRDRHDGAVSRRHDRTGNRRVFVQRQVRAGPFEVRAIEGHQPLQARFVEHDHVIEALTTGGTHKSLDEWILPGHPRCRDDCLDSDRLRRGLQAVERMIALVER